MKRSGLIVSSHACVMAAAAFLVAVVASGQVWAGVPEEGMTVGSLAIHVARSLGLQPKDGGALTPEAASWALWSHGVKMRPQVQARATEEDLVLALRQIGFTVTATRPDRPLTQEKTLKVLSTFVNDATAAELLRRGRVGLAAGNGGDDFNNGNGKGGKFKRKGPKSPSGENN